MNKSLFGLAPGLFSVFLFSACTSNDSKYEPVTKDYCAQIQQVSPGSLSSQLDSLADRMQTGTGVYVLEEGDISMISRAWLCASAEQTIDIQYFIFSADNIGLIAIDYLIRAADRGVKVRLLVDDIMVEADIEELLALDTHPNLEIRIYNPTANMGKNLPQKLYSLTSDFLGFNQRMHNKTFIVDGKAVITGGRNIADEYFDYDHAYNFRDRDVLLLGKVSEDVAKSFELFWGSEQSVSISQLAKEEDYGVNPDTAFDYLHQYACNPENFWPEVRSRINAFPETFQNLLKSGKLHWIDRVSFVSDFPGKNSGEDGLDGGGATTDSLVSLIQRARKSIYISSPYLVTTDLSQSLFEAAVKRGVDVRVLTNSLSSTDNLEAFSGYKRERENLLNLGVKIFEFRPDAAVRFRIMTGALQREMNFTPVFGLHAKTMMIDDEISVIGTFNLDPRSANLNTECFAVIYDPQIAEDLGLALLEDMKPENAWETTLAFNPDSEAGWKKRFGVWTRNLLPKSIL